MLTSKLTSKARTTIPKQVREALGLRKDDAIAYALETGRAILTRVEPLSDDPFKTFAEWDSEADRRAYASL